MSILDLSWSSNLAYVVGLIATDGCLSKDGRHIDLTSKDIEQIQNFKKILNLNNKIGTKYSSSDHSKIYYRLEFGNVKFYRFLLSIGLTPHKSLTIGVLNIPDKYFRDFLRGCLDGDGYTSHYWDAVYPNSFRFYTGFTCASRSHLEWLSTQIERLFEITGRIKYGSRVYYLTFAKNASVKLLHRIYYKNSLICLNRKRFKIEEGLGIIATQAGVLKLVDNYP